MDLIVPGDCHQSNLSLYAKGEALRVSDLGKLHEVEAEPARRLWVRQQLQPPETER